MSKKGQDYVDQIIAQRQLSQDQINECLKFAETSNKRCYDIIKSGDWKVEKITSAGDTIYCKTLPKPVGKIFKITATFKIDAKTLLDHLIENTETSMTWNKQVAEARLVFKLNDSTDVSYQASEPLAGGAISPRDFVFVRHRGQHQDYFINSVYSPSFNDVFPTRKNFVRAESGLACYATRNLAENSCEFTWILNSDLKGWIPQKVTDAFMPTGITEFLDSLRNHVPNIPTK